MSRNSRANAGGLRLEDYLALSYPIELYEDDGAFTVLYPDLPGCISYGDTLEEAMASLDRTKRLWMEGRFEAGMSIPRPLDSEAFSGKFLVRVPKSLHRSLHDEARREGVSLNQYVTHVLSSRQKTAETASELERACVRVLSNIGRTLAEKHYYAAHTSLRGAWHMNITAPSVKVLKVISEAVDENFTYLGDAGTKKQKFLEVAQ